MARSLILALLAGGCLAQDKELPRTIPAHHANKVSPQFFVAQGSGSGHGNVNSMASITATVQANPSVHKMDIAVTWKDAPSREIHPGDWIGVWDKKLLTEFHAPVKFKYVFAYGAKKNLATYGSMNFTVWNLRSSYVFIYISGNMQYPAIIAQSAPIEFSSVDHPQQAHLALSPTDSKKMLVMWTQKYPTAPILKWGVSPDKLVNTVTAAKDTYKKTDFCDTDISPAGRQGWFEPGMLMTAEMPIEAGQTYFYTVGDADANLFLEEPKSFTAPPTGKSGPTKLILFGDMGNAPADGSCHHSWDFRNHGELPSKNTTRLMEHVLDKQGAHAVVHFGDIAYSVGYLSEWDEFMLQVEPVSSRIPWMASVGNHEVGWSGSDPFNGTLETAMDSGGECGVAFLKRFPYAMQPLPKSNTPWREADPWYSFDVGSVHFTMLSSEHDYRIGSPQWKWMVADLKKVDRSTTPWLAVTCHRAMYIASDYSGDQAVGQLLRDNVEPQLLKYGVDFFFAGHHHSYQRYCKLNNGTCVDDQNDKSGIGIYHFVAGMAGYDHSPVCKNSTGGRLAVFTDDTHWGATYWEFNQTSATMKFLDGATEEVVDQASFQKPAVRTVATVVI